MFSIDHVKLSKNDSTFAIYFVDLCINVLMLYQAFQANVQIKKSVLLFT